MAKPTRRRAVIVEGADGEPEAAPNAATPETQDQLEGRERRAPRAAEARLSRMNPRTAKWGLLYKGPPDVVTPTWVQDACGGGEYKIEIYGDREDGKYGALSGGYETFSVDESLPFKGPPTIGAVQVAAPVALAAAPPAPAPDSFGRMMELGVFQLFKGMQDQAAETARQNREHSLAMAALMERIAHSNTPVAPVAPAPSQIPAILAAVAPLLAPFLANIAGKNPVEMATQIAALAKGGGSGLGDIETILELAERFSKRANGEDEVTVASVLKESLPGALEVVGKLVDQNASRPARADGGPIRTIPAPRAAAVIAPHPDRREVAPPMTGTAEPVATTQDEWTPLEGPMAQLVGFAKRGTDARHVVGMVMAIASDEQKATLRELIAREGIAEAIVARFPALAPYPTWLQEFLSEVHFEFFGEEEPAAPPAAGEPNE